MLHAQQMLVAMLIDMMSACSPEHSYAVIAWKFAQGILRHFAFLYAIGWDTGHCALIPPSSRLGNLTLTDGEPTAVATLMHISPAVLVDAIAEVPSLPNTI